MRTLYHIIIAAALIAALPYVLLRSAINPAFREDMMRRLDSWKDVPFYSGCIWIHAASMGEVRIAKTLIEQFRESYGEDRPIILSTFTLTGYQLAMELGMPKVFRMPPDLAFFIRPLLEKLDPSVVVLVEAELWPSLLKVCEERNVPVLVLNGRISRKSFRRYRLVKRIFQWLTRAVTQFAVRSQTDADYLYQLGTAKDKVLVTGNMKFDALTVAMGGPHPERDLFASVIFVSTRPGDEEPILDAIVRLKKDHPEAQFVLAPRHTHRVEEIERMVSQRGLKYALHSQLSAEDVDGQPGLILVNEMGTLDQYYRRACVAYVGGGFNPKFGGQNILEPALYSLPVIFGKHMNNFHDEARLLVQSGGGIQIKNAEELFAALSDLLSNRGKTRKLGERALETVRLNRGATKKNAELILKTLNEMSDLKTAAL